MLDSQQDSAALGDVGELYRELSKPLEQIVRLGVCAPEPVIEDACQVAWSRLLHHRERIRPDTSLAWLAQTARREAFKLDRRERRELSLETALEASGQVAGTSAAVPGPDRLVAARERLAQLERLPLRQRRALWLLGLGFSHAEIAQQTGDTSRTVERQLTRAKESIRGFEVE